ncbi:MAG: hypothetical protein MJ074_06685 [Oscillospiraceae bacterium]|nr:hypothetical protein [Oscillospiraceae bacterium]
MKQDKKLEKWQSRLQKAEQDYKTQQDRMKRREELVEGSHEIVSPDGKPAKKQATHVRNVSFEIVETQVDSNIPQPKVTAVREEDESLAKIIEDMLRNVLDRLPFERMNDEAERICPTQGGLGMLADWYSQASGRDWMGDLKVTMLHPRKIVPQPGIYQVADMDYIFVKDAMTKRQVKQRYNVDVSDESEEDPDSRALGATAGESDELVTMITAYYRNDKGGIGRIRWVGDTLLEDLEDYQVRRVKRCKRCDAIGDGIKCSYCGSSAFAEELQEEEELTEDLVTAGGMVIPAESQARDENGQPMFRDVETPRMAEPMTFRDFLLPQMEPAASPVGIYEVRQEPVMEPTRIPYYKPDIFPIVMRKNVSKPGSFLGGSDIDAIADQQNTLNQIGTKMKEKVLGGGSFVTVKKGMGRFMTDGDNRKLEVENPADLQCIHVYNTQVDMSADLALRSEVYEEARQTIGITDSMQGRRDPTATSAVAKEFAASRAAGRLESKRVMKNALFQDLFEVIFKFMLAYADEPRPVVAYNEQGEREYKLFDRHDFLYQDAAGNWKYNTDFLFSCDTAAPLASNREAMWQETRMNFQQGTFGNQAELTTLIRFWETMEKLHYPMAAQMKNNLQAELEEQRQQAAMAQQAAQMAQQAAPMAPMGMEMPVGAAEVGA